MNVLIADPASFEAISYLQTNGLKVTYNSTISSAKLIEQIPHFDALMVRSRTKVTKVVLEKGNNLKIIGRIGSGYDNIDTVICKEKKITVVNAPDANSISVAELTVGLIISFLRQLPRAFSSMKEGLWLKDELWGHELSSQTVGIVGYGYVGTKVDKLVSAFGAKTLVYSRSYRTATLPEIFEQCDIITLHLALNPNTKGIITRELLGKMKKSAFILNISRGQIIDEEALYEMLYTKKITGAILDVYNTEPLQADSKWRKLSNVLLTPHIGAATRDALVRASMTVAEDIVRVLNGEKPFNEISY